MVAHFTQRLIDAEPGTARRLHMRTCLVSTRTVATCLAAFLLVVCSRKARAGGPLGPNGSRINTSSYALDLFQGPVFAGTRVTGLAGAYVAIAEDVDGDLQNPATPAVRPFFSYSYFDYWLGFGLTFPATLSNVDFFNSGSTTHLANPPDSFVFFQPAVNLQWGELGIGLTPELQQYALSNSTTTTGSPTRNVSVAIATTHLQFAHGILHNQWVFGVGARILAMNLREPGSRQAAAFSSTGNGLEFGVVWKPVGRPLRLGLAFRSGIRTEASYRAGFLPDSNGDLIATSGTDAVYLPTAVALPWDLNFGFAVQFGGRPFNPPWRRQDELIERQTLQHRLRQLDRDTERNRAMAAATTPDERERIRRRFESDQQADDRELERASEDARWRIERDLVAMNRFYVQVAGSMVVSGAVDGAVGVESLVTQTVDRSGEQAVVSMRVGVESGVVPEYLKLRAGTYLEPTRFQDSAPRLHGTLGVDVKLARWDVFGLWPSDYMWRLGLGGDAAHRYYTWGVTIGGWYPRHTAAEQLPPQTADGFR